MADFKKNNKKKKNVNQRPRDFGSNQESRIEIPDMCPELIEYKMGKRLAETLVQESKGKKPQETLCDYVNTQCGLKGFCVRVIVDAN